MANNWLEVFYFTVNLCLQSRIPSSQHPERRHITTQPVIIPCQRNKKRQSVFSLILLLLIHNLPIFFYCHKYFFFYFVFLVQALSPVRFNQQSTPHLTTGDREIHRLLENSPSGVTYEQPSFAESWPSTDCESSPTTSTPSYEMDTSTHTVKAGKSTFSSELGNHQEPSLAKYALFYWNQKSNVVKPLKQHFYNKDLVCKAWLNMAVVTAKNPWQI